MRELNFAEEGFVKSGQKAISELNPVLEAVSSNNGFRLNNKAMTALGVKVGERVVMFDMKPAKDTVPNDERYFICAAGFQDKDGVEQGSIIGANRSFTYGQIWGAIQVNNPEVKSIHFDDMIKLDLGEVTANGSKVAKQIVTADLVPYGEGETVIPGGNERFLFRLTNLRFKPHTPKVINRKIEEEVDVSDLPQGDK